MDRLFFTESIVTLFLIFNAVPSCLSNTDLYRSCSNQTSCGNIIIKYPFWGHGRVSDCGFPELEVTCDKDVASIKLNDFSYRVLDINHDNHVLRIARKDFLNAFCPPEFVNSTLNPVLFENLPGYVNVTFVYGCLPGAFPALPVFTCAVRGSSLGTGYIRDGAVGPGPCYKSVYFPINFTAIVHDFWNQTAGEKLFKEGFELRWKIDNAACSECIRSQGACGYNPDANQTVCHCSNGSATCSSSLSPDSTPSGPGIKVQRKVVIGLSIAGAIVAGIVASCYYLYASRCSRGKTITGRKNKNHKQIEAVIRNYDSLIPKRYSYSEIRKMTNSFKEKLGEGGFGSVYKGKLPNGDVVAVKISRESNGDGADFINEVASFSRTSHVNIIRLLGFCYEETRRALIYEYMSNGSLDKFTYDQRSSLHDESHLNREKLYEIAVGIARGLEYLHRGCTTRIVHFDIKPHNILLDEDFCPKISDFGLAKLAKTRESRVSMLDARGTIGYIAPEIMYRSFGEVSYRADVYSYGMMVLEIIGKRKNINNGASETYFPDWIYEHMETVGASRVHEIVTGTDAEDIGGVERISKMVIVGLWCIQMNPSDRPSMTKVVEMLEGSLESLQVPPQPVLHSSAARLSSTCSSTTSQFTTTIPLQLQENS